MSVNGTLKDLNRLVSLSAIQSWVWIISMAMKLIKMS